MSMGWENFVAYSQSSSGSRGSSSSWSGTKQEYQPFVRDWFEYVRRNMPSDFSPQVGLLNFHNAYLAPTIAEQWKQNTMPVFQHALGRVFNALGARGIIDSSVGQRVMGQVASRFASDLSNLLGQMYQSAFSEAINAPYKQLATLLNLARIASEAARESTAMSSYDTSGSSVSYNPSSLISLLSII